MAASDDGSPSVVRSGVVEQCARARVTAERIGDALLACADGVSPAVLRLIGHPKRMSERVE